MTDLVSGLLDYDLVDVVAGGIFGHLDAQSLVACLRTCRRWRDFLLANLAKVDLEGKELREGDQETIDLRLSFPDHDPYFLLFGLWRIPSVFCRIIPHRHVDRDPFPQLTAQEVLGVRSGDEASRVHYLRVWEHSSSYGAAQKLPQALQKTFRDLAVCTSPTAVTLHKLKFGGNRDKYEKLSEISVKSDAPMYCFLQSVGSKVFVALGGSEKAGVFSALWELAQERHGDGSEARLLWTSDTREEGAPGQYYSNAKIGFLTSQYCGMADVIGADKKEVRVEYAPTTASESHPPTSGAVTIERISIASRSLSEKQVLFSHNAGSYLAVVQCQEAGDAAFLPCTLLEMSANRQLSVELELPDKGECIWLPELAMSELSGGKIYLTVGFNESLACKFLVYSLDAKESSPRLASAVLPVRVISLPRMMIVSVTAATDRTRLWVLHKLTAEEVRSGQRAKVAPTSLHGLVLGGKWRLKRSALE